MIFYFNKFVKSPNSISAMGHSFTFNSPGAAFAEVSAGGTCKGGMKLKLRMRLGC